MKKTPFDRIALQLQQLTDDELRSTSSIIRAMLEAREDERAEEIDTEPPKTPTLSAELPNGRGKGGQRGYHEYKVINGCGPYLYLRYRDGKILRSKYLGKVEKP